MWQNNDTDQHTTTSGSGCTGDGLWDSGPIDNGQTFTYTFSTAGTYSYFCSINCSTGMTGTITVNDIVEVNATRPSAPLNLKLKSYPNPFGQFSNVEFELSEAGKVRMEIYDLLGKKIESGEETFMDFGKQSLPVTCLDKMSTGIFICKIYFNDTPAGSVYLIKGND